MKKHAYLITAHDNLYTLGKLIHLLNDKRNEIYVHIDSKCNIPQNWIENMEVDNSMVHYVERTDVKWGGFVC